MNKINGIVVYLFVVLWFFSLYLKKKHCIEMKQGFFYILERWSVLLPKEMSQLPAEFWTEQQTGDATGIPIVIMIVYCCCFLFILSLILLQ